MLEVHQKRLVSLSSGATVPPEVEKDVLDAEKIGKEQKDAFIKERLVEKKKGFFDPHTPTEAENNGPNIQKREVKIQAE